MLRERFTFRILDVTPRGNGVTVNGRQVRNHELSSGEVIKVCGRQLRFSKGLPQLRDLAATRPLGRVTPKLKDDGDLPAGSSGEA